MTVSSFPARDSRDWYAWAQDVDAKARAVDAYRTESLLATAGGSSGNDATFQVGSAFTTVPLGAVAFDTASGFNTSSAIYTIPVSGFYDVNATLRVQDGNGGGVQVGMGVDISNNDSPTFAWQTRPSGTLRHTFGLSRNAHWYAGDQVRLFAYVDAGSPLTFAAASLSLTLIGKG